jgi:hypothetical protein
LHISGQRRYPKLSRHGRPGSLDVWAIVHGIAMLAIDGQLHGTDDRGEALTRYAVERIRAAIEAGP